jgi:2-C-methyl-D-erythritol 4-phosphate cytidylyltransferase
LFSALAKATAIIVAAGEGLRIGGKISKPYLPLCGRAMVLRTLDRFFAARSIEQVVLVVAAGELPRCEEILKGDSLLARRPWVLQRGGATRQQSVKAGLEMPGDDADIVVIHDGARPFVSPRLIDRCVEWRTNRRRRGRPAGKEHHQASDDHRVLSTPDRKALWEIQTPQAFRRGVIVEAHEWAVREEFAATDDAMLVEQTGKPVWVIDGEKTNLKITVPEDLWLAEAMIREGRIP